MINMIQNAKDRVLDLTIKAYAVELYPDRSGWASGLTTAATETTTATATATACCGETKA